MLHYNSYRKVLKSIHLKDCKYLLEAQILHTSMSASFLFLCLIFANGDLCPQWDAVGSTSNK